MRINKYLAHKGIATRLNADELIRAKIVFINLKIAQLGDKVLESDIVEVRGAPAKKEYVYLAYNKAKGIVTANPQKDEKDILNSISLPPQYISTKIFPVGRLDKDSHGLIILTNDGRITDRLLNPINKHEKEYVVEVDQTITPVFINHMQNGVAIGDHITERTTAKKISSKTFSIILTEGKNRQIKKMTDRLGYTVVDLKRIRIQNITLNKLSTNTAREITGNEKEKFLTSLGL